MNLTDRLRSEPVLNRVERTSFPGWDDETMKTVREAVPKLRPKEFYPQHLTISLDNVPYPVKSLREEIGNRWPMVCSEAPDIQPYQSS